MANTYVCTVAGNVNLMSLNMVDRNAGKGESMRTIDELLSEIDKADAEHRPNRRAELADTLLDEIREIFDDDRLQEICEAEKDGRLVVLPCKVGDIVYYAGNCAEVCKYCDDDYVYGTGDITCPFERSCEFEECEDTNVRIFETECSGFWYENGLKSVFFKDLIVADCSVSDFGKTVFLTREEAEAKLKELEASNGATQNEPKC